MSFRVAYGNAWSENGWRMVNADGCVWSTIPGTGVSVQLRQGVPTTILVAFASRFNQLIEPLRDADTAGWTPTNSVPTSNHLAGTAMDLNWNSHPFHAKGTFGDRLPKLRELLNFFEGAVFWGGDWRSPIDEMHFQLGWPEGDKRYVNVINKLAGGVKPVAGEGLTAQTLSQAMGSSLPLERYEALLPAVKESLRQCDCTTLNRVAMWMAQVGHESGGLRWMEEIADGSAYEGRRDLGNTQPGDGRKFKGHGPIQITGRYNHSKVSEWAYSQEIVTSPTFFVDNPRELASDRYGFVGVTWYWTVARNMNGHADAGDIEGATRAVNGGLNGLQDRVSRWNRCRAMGYESLSVTDTVGGKDDGVLMALTDAEQRELLDLARQQAGLRRVSRSPLRHLGEGPTETIAGFAWSTDGSVHVMVVELLASLGHPPTLALLNEIASADPARHPDRQEDRKIAQAILNKLAMGAAAKVAAAQQPVLPLEPEPVPVEPVPTPPRWIADETVDRGVDGGDLYSQMSDLRNQIHSLTAGLADLSSAFLGKK